MNEEKPIVNVEVSEELRATIEKTIKELKEKDAKLRVVYPIIVAGDEFDDKELYGEYSAQGSWPRTEKWA